jgi:hypothetical protein
LPVEFNNNILKYLIPKEAAVFKELPPKTKKFTKNNKVLCFLNSMACLDEIFYGLKPR